MQRSLSKLQEESKLLQESLDQYRAQQYARVASSVDSNDEGSDILRRLNIGNIDAGTGRRHTESGNNSTRSTSGSTGGGGISGGRSVSSQSTRGSTTRGTSRRNNTGIR